MDFTEKQFNEMLNIQDVFYGDTRYRRNYQMGKLLRETFVFHTGAVAVLVIRDGKMLLVRQYRKPLEMHFLEIPAGKLDSKEEVPLEAAKRELEEETNLVAEGMGEDDGDGLNPWILRRENHIIPSKNVTVKEDAKPADEDEFVEILWMPLKK